MSNGLPDWDQMSVREQCEVLKARLDGIDEKGADLSKRWHSLGVGMREIGDDLDSRVSALEAAQGRTQGPRFMMASGFETEPITGELIDRWRRIEEALAGLLRVFDYYGVIQSEIDVRQAREAMKP